jgi:hypothetical protein
MQPELTAARDLLQPDARYCVSGSQASSCNAGTSQPDRQPPFAPVHGISFQRHVDRYRLSEVHQETLHPPTDAARPHYDSPGKADEAAAPDNPARPTPGDCLLVPAAAGATPAIARRAAAGSDRASDANSRSAHAHPATAQDEYPAHAPASLPAAPAPTRYATERA